MRYLTEWIKSNPLTVIFSAIALVSLIALVWFAWALGGGFEQRLADRADKINEIDRYLNQRVRIPSEKAGQPAQSVSGVTINQPEVDRLKAIYQDINGQYQRISRYAVQRNREGHFVLAEGLFPEPETTQPKIVARSNYRGAFDLMLKPSAPDARLPRLDAGMPPSPEMIKQRLGQLKKQMERELAFGRSNRKLTEADQKNIRSTQRSRLIMMLRDRAQSLHLYANPDIEQPTYPFDVNDLSKTGSLPPMWRLWEAQLELWIQQDIVRAIARANQVSNASVNILSAPVKRLLAIDVIPGYVGLHTLGGLQEQYDKPPRKQNNLEYRKQPYPAPYGGMTDSADQRQSDNFYVGPTGRVSNGLYDVRHARLVAIVDAEQLPTLLESLSQVNFMTVLDVDMEDVDEHEALREGYLYGQGDVVKVDMILETLWLRDWTKPLMPSLVKQYVGLAEPTDLEEQEGMQENQMYGPMMGPGGWGGMAPEQPR